MFQSFGNFILELVDIALNERNSAFKLNKNNADFQSE